MLQLGFSSGALTRHKDTIKNYVIELGVRGVLDEADPGTVGKDKLRDETQDWNDLDIDTFAHSGGGLAEDNDPTEPTHEAESKEGSMNALAKDLEDVNVKSSAADLGSTQGSLNTSINGWLRKNITNDNSAQGKDKDLPDLSELRSRLSPDAGRNPLSQDEEIQRVHVAVADQPNGNIPQHVSDSNIILCSRSGDESFQPVALNRSGDKKGKRKEIGIFVKTQPGADASQCGNMTSLSPSIPTSTSLSLSNLTDDSPESQYSKEDEVVCCDLHLSRQEYMCCIWSIPFMLCCFPFGFRNAVQIHVTAMDVVAYRLSQYGSRRKEQSNSAHMLRVKSVPRIPSRSLAIASKALPAAFFLESV